MLFIRKQQIDKLQEIYSNQFYSELHQELLLDQELVNRETITIEELKRIVNDAIGANIKEENLIYQFCVIVLNNRILFNKPFQVWIKNILYSDGSSDYKINCISDYIIQSKND
jgi:hypothetical protein